MSRVPDTQATLAAASAAQLAEILQAAGCRATVVDNQGQPEVHSAVQGLGFFLRLGNTQPEGGGCLDFTWICPLALRTELPPQLIEQWNNGTRFGRLGIQGRYLLLSMDTLLAGGVSRAHLQAQFEIWARLLQQLHTHLRRPTAASAA